MKATHSEDDSEGSEEFFDAEESLPRVTDRQQQHNNKKRSPKSTSDRNERFQFPADGPSPQPPPQSSTAPPLAELQRPLRGPLAPAAVTVPMPTAGPVHEFLEPKTASRQRFRELRQCMQHDDDENPGGNTLTPDSQNSSVEGVFPAGGQRPSHPFRIIEQDAMSIQSMTSLGRVGRILAGSLDAASLSGGSGAPPAIAAAVDRQPVAAAPPVGGQPLPQQQQQQSSPSEQLAAAATPAAEPLRQSPSPVQKINFSEPDVIASTKLAHSKTTDSLKTTNTTSSGSVSSSIAHPDAATAADATMDGVPIAPPRRKKRVRKLSASSEQFNPNESSQHGAAAAAADTLSLQLDLNRPNSRHTPMLPLPPLLHQTSLPATATAAAAAAPTSAADLSPSRPAVRPYPFGLSSPATAAIASLTRDIENSFTESAATAAANATASASSTSSSASLKVLGTNAANAAIGRISHSLGNSSTSVYAASPSGSAKSNSAPGRVHAIDPTQGLNLYKATRGQYVVKPQDEPANKAEGPSAAEIERVERIRAEILGAMDRQRPPLGPPGSVAASIGTNSLGNGAGMRFSTSGARLAAAAAAAAAASAASGGQSAASARERRKSAGDEDVLRQLNICVRTRTDSGRQLSDLQILEQVPVKNLDTGERMPLSVMKPPPVPAGWNPLSLHIHKLTCHLEPLLLAQQKESDEESVLGIPAEAEKSGGAGGGGSATKGGRAADGAIGADGDEDGDSAEDGGRLRKKTARLKRFIGSTMRKTVDRAKLIASEVSHARHKEDVADIVDVVNPEQNIKIKASSTNKGPYEFTKLQHVQDLSGEHTGAVWCMKFSSCGRLLATAGQDRVLRIWVLREAYAFFQDMRTKYNADAKASPTPSQESLVSHHSVDDAVALAQAADAAAGPFMPKAFCTYTGHTSDLLDVSWSKNYFILSSSMDKTVRLWHISRRECLCCFQHIDFVTAIAFHPRDDRYFLSGSLDGKLRLWNIPDKKVALWNEVDGQTKLITAANFCQNGKFAVVGTYDGRCIFYNTDQLKYHTQIHVRSTRGRNKTGRKISGIEPMPGEDKILVTSNDSRVRLYDLRDLNLSCKYKGYANVSSQIKASFSNDGKYIVAGSENQCIYIWKTSHDYSKLSSVRRDRSDFWEGIKAHNATVTCAIFAPNPEAIIKTDPDDDNISRTSHTSALLDPMAEQRKKSCGYVLISADFNGAIKVFINKTKPKHSSLPYTAIQD